MRLLTIEKSDGRRYDILLEMFFVLHAQYVLKKEQTPFPEMEIRWKADPAAMIKEFKECAQWSEVSCFFKTLPNRILPEEEKEQMWRDAKWSEQIEPTPLKTTKHSPAQAHPIIHR